MPGAEPKPSFVERLFADHRADDRTQVAADAVRLAHLRDGFAGDTARAEAMTVRRYQVDALVRAVLTRDVTEIAADALVVIDAGNALVIQIERLDRKSTRLNSSH